MSQIQKLLLEKINNNQKLINDWFEAKFTLTKPLFNNSIDLRHSGFKIAPVDNNCFPAGFNNLGADSKVIARQIAAEFFKKNYPEAKKILLIPESHTRNLKYLQNVAALKEILENEGKIEVVLGSLISDLEDELAIDLENGSKIILHKLIKQNNKIVAKSGFEADVIVSNNDFTNLPEEILLNIKQDIVPTLQIGWHNRTKSQHFNIYSNLAKELAALIQIDSWLIDSIHRNCANVDFKHKNNIENLANLVDEVITEIQEKYQEYEIMEEPYCFIKADSGTYGLGMITVKNANEVKEINKKQRNKMNVIKGNVVNDRVIIQEGIPTIDKIQGITAEPMIYLINGQVIGNLSRVNGLRDRNISLNAAGMEFYDINELSDTDLKMGSVKKDVFKIYNLIGRLSALAAANESY